MQPHWSKCLLAIPQNLPFTKWVPRTPTATPGVGIFGPQVLFIVRTTHTINDKKFFNSAYLSIQIRSIGISSILRLVNRCKILFPTRLLTSEDEYKWYWHQMIYFPETINTISTTITPSPTHSLVSS
jgi:hypothetical protein